MKGKEKSLFTNHLGITTDYVKRLFSTLFHLRNKERKVRSCGSSSRGIPHVINSIIYTAYAPTLLRSTAKYDLSYDRCLEETGFCRHSYCLECVRLHNTSIK